MLGLSVSSWMVVPVGVHRPGPGISRSDTFPSNQHTMLWHPLPFISAKHFGQRNITPLASAMVSTR